ncbi:sulfotransferase 1C2-like [Lingula anatina]|uniref:Sulfotransferase 1C2-like n=1 Tax=Lingula anatina TaxID=7574 RepID=A0A1S3KF09_LINAN|nr:sulfotransferase 1C2-like [Lingula anatina]|eukprot:XP_013421044.1 sulfotransferase 1C2-like [Lingula anatina]
MAEIRVKDAGGHEYNVIEWRGMYFPLFPGIVPRLETLGTFECRKDDILLLTYPKSGTRWIYYVVSMVKNNSTDDPSMHSMYLEMLDQEDFAKMASPRILSSHLPIHLLPPDVWSKQIKIILVTRNPKDVAVSYYNFLKGLKKFEYSGPWESYFPIFTQGKVPYGSWFDHTKEMCKRVDSYPNCLFLTYEDMLKIYVYLTTCISLILVPYGSWFDHTKEMCKRVDSYPNCLFLTYEDMLKDLPASVKKINSFLGFERSDAFLEEVAQKCTFSSMKRSEETGEPQTYLKDGHRFYRKGQVADWKNWFTVAQNEEFDELYHVKMADAPPDLKSRVVFE